MAEVLAVVGVATSLVGGVVGAVESFSQARQQNALVARNNLIAQRNAELTAQHNERNAKIAERNAALERRRRDRELQANRRRFKRQQGSAIAQAAAQGARSFGGSLGDILADIEFEESIAFESIIEERTFAAVNHDNQAAALRNRAAQARASFVPDNTSISGLPGAIGSIASGIGSAVRIGAGGFGGAGASDGTVTGTSFVNNIQFEGFN